VQGFSPGVGGRDELLSIVEAVVNLPEGLRVLIVSTATRQGSRLGPRVNLFDREVLKVKLYQWIVRQQRSHLFMQLPANRAFKIGKLDDGYRGTGSTEGRHTL